MYGPSLCGCSSKLDTSIGVAMAKLVGSDWTPNTRVIR